MQDLDKNKEAKWAQTYLKCMEETCYQWNSIYLYNLTKTLFPVVVIISWHWLTACHGGCWILIMSVYKYIVLEVFDNSFWVKIQETNLPKLPTIFVCIGMQHIWTIFCLLWRNEDYVLSSYSLQFMIVSSCSKLSYVLELVFFSFAGK